MLLSNRKQLTRLKQILIGTIVLIFVAVIYVFIAQKPPKPDEQNIDSSTGTNGNSQISEIIDYHQDHMREGIKEWSLDAESLRYSEQKKQATLKSPKVIYYIKDSEPAVLTANKGQFHTEKKNIRAIGNVVVQNDKFKLTTEELRFNNKNQRVSIEKPLTITGQSFSLKADRMDLNINSKTARFKGHVEGEFYETMEF